MTNVGCGSSPRAASVPIALCLMPIACSYRRSIVSSLELRTKAAPCLSNGQRGAGALPPVGGRLDSSGRFW